MTAMKAGTSALGAAIIIVNAGFLLALIILAYEHAREAVHNGFLVASDKTRLFAARLVKHGQKAGRRVHGMVVAVTSSFSRQATEEGASRSLASDRQVAPDSQPTASDVAL